MNSYFAECRFCVSTDQHPGDVTSDDVVTLYRDVNKYALVHYCSVFMVLISSIGLRNNIYKFSVNIAGCTSILGCVGSPAGSQLDYRF